MYRFGFILITLLAVALGLLIGTLNSDVVTIDLLWLTLDWPLGLLIVSALTVGLLIGFSLAWLFSILPLRARLRRSQALGAQGSSISTKSIND